MGTDVNQDYTMGDEKQGPGGNEEEIKSDNPNESVGDME